MNLLICNDDGIKSEGIITLAKELSKHHKVYVIAPSDNRSATGHAITIGKKLKLKKRNTIDGVEAYSLSGTPADCVKFAINTFNVRFDAVVSGINKGPNLGTDVMYSGTVSAALEAMFFKIPSVAVSLTSHSSKNFGYAAKFIAKNLECLIETCDGEFVWNVNVPAVQEDLIAGVKYTKMGYQVYSDFYRRMYGGYYSLSGEPLSHDKNDADCDVEWNLKKFVTITPVLFNKTDFSALKRVEQLCKI